MSISLDARKRFVDGQPLLFWVNRITPFMVGSQNVAHSGKVCIVRKVITSMIGKPMVVKFMLARKTHITTWQNLFDSDPFSTTVLASYFSTGHQVVWNMDNPITLDGHIIKDFDIDQTIFDSGNGDYRKGFDLFSGTLSLIITS